MMKSGLMAVALSSAPVALLVAALLAWQRSRHWTLESSNPEAMLWSVRLGAIAAAALAQALIVMLVCRCLYRPSLFDRILQASAGLVGAVAIVAAVALALAGQ
jgi:hypothetical protein